MMKQSLCSWLAALSFAGGNVLLAETAAPGFLEGDFSIRSERGAELADPKPSPTPDTTSFKEYRLAVLSRDHRTEIAEVSVDEHGHYRLALPPGDYLLEVKKRSGNQPRVGPHPFTIASQKTVRVNMEIDAAFPPPM